LTATDTLTLKAGRDLSIKSITSSDINNRMSEEYKDCFAFGAGGISYSKAEQNQLSNGTTVTQVASTVSAGSVTATSARDTRIDYRSAIQNRSISLAEIRNVPEQDCCV
jgi:filamentous hemagglutinin